MTATIPPDGRPFDGTLTNDDPCPDSELPLCFAVPLLIEPLKKKAEYAPDPLNEANGLVSVSLLAPALPDEAQKAPVDEKFAR